MSEGLNHFDASGRPRMVDVGGKEISLRRAIACGRLHLSAAGWSALEQPEGAGKGDPIPVAQVAAIQAAKRCSDWIPMAHPLQLSGVEASWGRNESERWVELRVQVSVAAQTGVEMEALCAVSAGLLTLYDMLKAADRGMWIGPVWLMRKEGGRSGVFERPELPGTP